MIPAINPSATPDTGIVDDAATVGLYVHWPFCLSKCPYCDFNSHVRTSINHIAWAEALRADLGHEARALPGRRLTSIFFGGGTPSLMPPAIVAAIIAQARNVWSATDDIEITLEANPSSVEAGRFADLAAAGVNRVSLGVQALDDAALRMLGRLHRVDEALAALDVAQAQFARVSIDLIYARPDQQEADWSAELARAIGFGTEHLSLYQLTIEPGTRFATLVRDGALTPLDPDRGADLFELTAAQTAAAGLPMYEVSNHARPGAESRHNCTYWRMDDYAGIGPGAHGRRGGVATTRVRKPENYLNTVAATGHGIADEIALMPSERATEALVMGLRMVDGVDIAAIARRTGIAAPVDDRAVARLVEQGLMRRADTRIAVTASGMLVLDAILRSVVATA